ncbi:MAG: S8/S53 family peptidase [Kiloniellales bacterium]|nr:S8/S53 family peptidase [Kiloniellales bacterium]
MQEWNLVHVRARQALAQLPGRPSGQVDWGTVRVAHLDTGYTENPAFGTWNNGRNDIILTRQGRDFLQPQRGTAEDLLKDVGFMEPGHGTRSGSALSANSAGITGVAPGLPIVPFRVTNSSLVTDREARAIAKAITHVVRQRVAPVVNISLGFPLLNDSAMGKAIDLAYENGVIVVAAAGQKIDRVTYPGKHRRTIGVAGIERRGKKHRIYAKYDRYGRIDVWAPAGPVRRANVLPEDPDEQLGDGTTYAAVHVSAAACMWLRKHGAAINQRYGRSWKRVEAFRTLLLTTGRLLPFKSPPTNRARGLDANKLLRASLPASHSLFIEADLAEDDRV